MQSRDLHTPTYVFNIYKYYKFLSYTQIHKYMYIKLYITYIYATAIERFRYASQALQYIFFLYVCLCEFGGKRIFIYFYDNFLFYDNKKLT